MLYRSMQLFDDIEADVRVGSFDTLCAAMAVLSKGIISTPLSVLR